VALWSFGFHGLRGTITSVIFKRQI
jgi:hypothetical protein